MDGLTDCQSCYWQPRYWLHLDLVGISATFLLMARVCSSGIGLGLVFRPPNTTQEMEGVERKGCGQMFNWSLLTKPKFVIFLLHRLLFDIGAYTIFGLTMVRRALEE